jgi:ATP-dependent RNA helicase DeaD
MKFSELALCPKLLDRLAEMKFVEPTPIQEKTIPDILQGKDVVGKAETGTGKTLAFSLPVMEKLDSSRVSIQCLILSPTRELAHQIAATFADFAETTGLKTATIVGGESQTDQMKDLHAGAQVVVGTPGRVLDLMTQGCMSLAWLEILVLDEADRMLDMGFMDQMQKILDKTPKERQTLLFSATFDRALRGLAQKYMKNQLEIETASGLKTAENISQKFVRVKYFDKQRLLVQLLEATRGRASIIFLNTKREAERVGKDLWGRGLSAMTLHGNMDQSVRNKVLESFRNAEFDVLVATDVAQRGLDIDRVERVVNYNVPGNPEDYVHRIGRTGRAGRQGTVLTFVDQREWNDFTQIQNKTGPALGELNLPDGFYPWTPGSGGGGGRDRSRSGGDRGGSRGGSRGGDRGGPRGGKSRFKGRGSRR